MEDINKQWCINFFFFFLDMIVVPKNSTPQKFASLITRNFGNTFILWFFSGDYLAEL